ncbi:unnamed protein product [Cylicocyclus nassatus]|uniref:KNTC1 first ARM-repeats domain-containing protein n=1 Tax=Cylicocyclus nassatus TaxID=53992 RepID=A0AA36GKA8_CYLNA|nr:unnamed protein product [Cylicocyclus nassatus]
MTSHTIFCFSFFSSTFELFRKPGRILWKRHFNHLATCFNGVNNEELAEGNLENFFEILRAVVLKKLNIWRDVIAFLEFDFIPVCLLKISKEICTLLVDFLLTLAHDLETLDAEDFPLNALHATSTFERFLLKQDEEIITGTRQMAFLDASLSPILPSHTACAYTYIAANLFETPFDSDKMSMHLEKC